MRACVVVRSGFSVALLRGCWLVSGLSVRARLDVFALLLRLFTPRQVSNSVGGILVDPASSHMLVSKIKPCMSKFTPLYGETANGSLNQSRFLR